MYVINETFASIQGEGHYAGTSAVFIRFAGCNVWSGRDQDRARDTARGGCAAWCDTNFRDGVRFESARELADHARSLSSTADTVILTGGEPALQVDQPLCTHLFSRFRRVHIETNGSIDLGFQGLTWICVSPKPPMPVKARYIDEIKVIFPAFDPLSFEPQLRHATVRYVQPLMTGDRAADAAHAAAAVEFVKNNPRWRLSLQTHKVIGIR